MTKQNSICHFKDVWLEDPQFSSWISKTSNATKARCKIFMKDIDIANMGVSALKSHATGDRHNCILKEQENKISCFLQVRVMLRLDLKNCLFGVTRETQLWRCQLKIFCWTSKSKIF